jgi:pilus assembly protein CpaE
LLDCVLISSDEGFRHSVLGILQEPESQARLVLDLPSSADNLDRAEVGRILQATPRVAFLDLGRGPSGLDGIRNLSQEAPDLILVVAGPELSADGLLAVMRAGASEFLPRPFSWEDVQDAFRRVRRRVVAVPAEAQAPPGRITAVFSAKGGTGVTTVATNLAVALRRLTLKDVLLVDLAPQMGTAALALGIEPRYSHLDVIQNFHRIDEELFRSFLEVHESGLCQRHFDYVVIDAGSTLSSQVMTILHEAEDRLLVATPELPALRNLKQALDVFGRTNGRLPPQLVLNQYKEGVGLSPREVEEGLGHSVAATLEREETSVLHSVNVGHPDVLIGKSRFSKNLMDFGAEIAGPDRVVGTRKGLFGRLFKGPKTTDSSAEEAA